MNRPSNIITALSLGLMLVFPFSCFSVSDTGETVSRHGTINDDYYAAGGKLNIDADIDGDAVVSGGELFIGRHVQGDVMAVGGSIKLRGKILDDVRTAGGDIDIDANIGDDLIAAGGTIRVSSATTTGGEAWLAGGNVDMAGTVDKDLHIGGGNIIISGTIHGDVELGGGEIQILESAIIKGNLYYQSPDEANIHSDAKITGTVTYEQADWDRSHDGYGIFFSLTMIIAGIVLFLLFPGFTMSAASRISTDSWKSLGIGFALLVVTPIAAILLMSIVLGVWVGLSILALYFVALLTGFLVACFFLGNWGAKLIHQDVSTTGRRLLSVSLAIVLLGFIQLVPVLGGLFIFALLLLGLGAGILQLHFSYTQSDET